MTTGELGYDRLNGTRKIGLSYAYDEYLICIGLGPSISSVIGKTPSYSGPSYPSSPVLRGNAAPFKNISGCVSFFGKMSRLTLYLKMSLPYDYSCLW